MPWSATSWACAARRQGEPPLVDYLVYATGICDVRGSLRSPLQAQNGQQRGWRRQQWRPPLPFIQNLAAAIHTCRFRYFLHSSPL